MAATFYNNVLTTNSSGGVSNSNSAASFTLASPTTQDTNGSWGSVGSNIYAMQQDDGVTTKACTATGLGGYCLTYRCDAASGYTGRSNCWQTDYNWNHAYELDSTIHSISVTKNCDNPKWVAASDCVPWYATNCVANANLGNAACASYCSSNPATCANAYQTYCATGNNAVTDVCQTYCNTASNAGKCDALRIQYCKNHPTDYNYCACQNLTPAAEAAQKVLINAGLTSITECNVSACRNNPNAWLTAQQQKTICPAQNICLQTLNATLSESQVAGVTYNCNISSTNTNASTGSTTSSTTPVAPAPVSPSTSSSTTTTTLSSLLNLNDEQTVYIVGTVIALLFVSSILGVTYVIRRRRQ